MVCVRVRLRFDSSPLHYAKKCWFVFDADQCSLVKDVAYLIARQFDLNQGIQLYMDDFLIPVNESAQVIRDNDLIWVKAVECESNNTSLVLSDDVQSPKTKRRKAEISEDKSKPEKSKTRTITSKPTSSKDTVNKVKAFISDTKAGGSSSKREPPAEKLKAVTKKSSTGATHTTFHSSSSSSSSETETSSSESDEAVGNDQKKKPTGNVKQTAKVNGAANSKTLQTRSNSLKLTPLVGNSLAKAKVGVKKQTVANAGSNKKRGRTRKRTLSANVTVGGCSDVFTTKSTLYKSPKQARSAEKIPPKNNHQTFNEASSSNSDGDSGKIASINDKTKKSPAFGTVGDKEREKPPPSQWDVQPKAPVLKVTSTRTVFPPQQTLQLPPPKDYSVFPELQGPPRQGDRLAFKVLELSSSYTPIVSEYKEASVLSFDSSTKTVHLEYSKETLMKCQAKGTGMPGKFEIQLDEDGGPAAGSDEPLVDYVHVLLLDSLIEPKLIT